MLRAWADPGSGSAGVSGRGMLWASTHGCIAWVLAWGLLAAALALPAGSSDPGRLLQSPREAPEEQGVRRTAWIRVPSILGKAAGAPRMKTPRSAGVSNPLPTSEVPIGSRAHSLLSLLPASWPEKMQLKREAARVQRLEAAPREAENGVIFQKCSVDSGHSGTPTAQVRLLVNNSRVPSAHTLRDLLLLDNVTGLRVQGSAGNRTAPGMQAFRREFLQVGDSFSVSYTASLEPGHLGDGDHLQLPALLVFQSSAKNRTRLTAPFTVTAEERIRVLPDHGLHAAAFLVALLVSLVLAWLSTLILIHWRCGPGGFFSWLQAHRQDHQLEHSQLSSAEGLEEDLVLSDQMVGILCSEDAGSMLPALEELELATLKRADEDLEALRTQVSREVVGLLLRGLASKSQLSPQAERALASAFQKQFLWLEQEVREEHERKLVALAAEGELEAAKRLELQQQREMVAAEHLEEQLQQASERVAGECSGLLRTLQGLEHEQLQRGLALQQEQEEVQARRQLAVFRRTELHRTFFTQIHGAVVKGALEPGAAEEVLRDYSRLQEDIEEVLDFLQASQRYHLSKRFGHSEYLVRNIQSSETHMQGLLNAASAQLSLLIQKHERAGYLDEEQVEVLSERMQTEVFSIKQKLEQDLRQERQKLQQKLVLRRRRELLQQHREQRGERLAQGAAWRAAGDAARLLSGWRRLLAEQGAALAALTEQLDRTAREELRALGRALAARALDELRRLRGSGLAAELRRGAPGPFVQPLLEEAARELAARARQLDARDRARAHEGLQGLRTRLREDCLEEAAREQAGLRAWEHRVFARLCAMPCSLSGEELLSMRQEALVCEAQLDRSLALPKVCARVLLQRAQTAWREAELLKLDEALAGSEGQPPTKARKSRSKSKSRAELVKKCLENKIQLFEAQAPQELQEKVRVELQAEREGQLAAWESSFAEALAGLQFRKAVRQAGTRGEYAALLGIRDLLLEALGEAGVLNPAALSQALEPDGLKLQELERRLEEKLTQQEAAGMQAPDPQLPEGPEEEPERQLSAVLLGALSRRHKLLEQQKQSLTEERHRAVMLEEQLEGMEVDTYMTLYSQELRLAAYLSRLTAIPGSTLRLLLSVTLPTVSQPELLTVLDPGSQKQSGAEGEAGEQEEQTSKGKHQGWWQDLESRLRGEMVSRGLEMLQWARQRKERVLKKPCPPLRERTLFSERRSWPVLSPERTGQLVPVSVVGAEAVDLLNTGEKVFIFRDPADPELTLHLPPRRKKKKKNFLNAKKAEWAQSTF